MANMYRSNNAKGNPHFAGGAPNLLGHRPCIQKVSLDTCHDLDYVVNPPKAAKMEDDELMLHT